MRLLCATLLCVIISIANAQALKSAKRVKKVKITDVFLQQLNGNYPRVPLSLADFKILAPQSILLNANLNGFTSGTSNYGTNTGGFNPSIGIQFANKSQTGYRANPILRIGFNLNGSTSEKLSYNKEDKYRVDTLTSSQTGEQIYIDSFVRESYSFYYSYKTIGVDVALLFRTNPKARWSIYGGVGANFGAAINSNLYLSNYKNSGRNNTFYYNGFSNSTGNSYTTIQTENFDGQNNTAKTASVYLPLGIDFRVGKRREFFKRVHLFLETRPSFSFVNFNNMYSQTDITNMAGLGLRVNW
jgi:hypothetical protein